MKKAVIWAKIVSKKTERTEKICENVARISIISCNEAVDNLDELVEAFKLERDEKQKQTFNHLWCSEKLWCSQLDETKEIPRLWRMECK